MSDDDKGFFEYDGGRGKRKIKITVGVGIFAAIVTIITAIGTSKPLQTSKLESDNAVQNIAEGDQNVYNAGGDQNVYNNKGDVNIVDDSNKEEQATLAYNNLTYDLLCSMEEQKGMSRLSDVILMGEKSNLYKKHLDPNQDAFELMVTNNNSKNEIQITNFTFYANNIQKINIPSFLCEISDDSNNVIELKIKNVGWGDASKINVKLLDVDASAYKITDIFRTTDFEKTVDVIKSGEEASIPLLNYKDIIDNSLSGVVLFQIEISCQENEEKTVFGSYNIKVAPQILEVPEGGGFGDSILVYGIMIDADKDKFEFSKNIMEEISPGEMLSVPIICFPNRSCKLDFYIELEITSGENKYKIKTDTITQEFEVLREYQNASFTQKNGNAYYYKEDSGQQKQYIPTERYSFPFEKSEITNQ